MSDYDMVFKRAQEAYDNMTPEDDDILMMKCEDCNGDGKVFDDGAPDAIPIECKTCKGSGEVPRPERRDPDEP